MLGKTIRIEGAPFTIIGVTAQRFHGLQLGFPPAVTFLLTQEYALASNTPNKSPFFWADVLVRLKPGVTQREIEAQLEHEMAQVARRIPACGRFKGANREELLSMPPKISSGVSRDRLFLAG